MPRFQRYGFPFQYYRPYNYMTHTPKFRPVPHVDSPSSQPSPPSFQATTSSPNSPREEKSEKPNDNVWLDILGIKLYFDDVLILSLLFFLYKEEVKDEGLFLALILLLIS